MCTFPYHHLSRAGDGEITKRSARQGGYRTKRNKEQITCIMTLASKLQRKVSTRCLGGLCVPLLRLLGHLASLHPSLSEFVLSLQLPGSRTCAWKLSLLQQQQQVYLIRDTHKPMVRMRRKSIIFEWPPPFYLGSNQN